MCGGEHPCRMRKGWAVFTAACLTFASIAAAAAQQFPPHPPDGTYIYRWNQSGGLAGRSTVVVHTTAAGVTMRTDTNLTNTALSGGTLALTGNLLQFASYNGYNSANGLDTSIDLKLLNGNVAGPIKSQSGTISVNVSLFGAVIAIDDGALGTFLMLPAQLNARGARSFQLLPISTGQTGQVDFSVSQSGPYPIGIPSSDAVGLFAGSSTIWYNPQTFVVDQFARGAFVATLIGHP